VRYKLDVRPAVRAYLHDIQGLSRRGRIAMYSALNDAAEVSDAFRTDPNNRLEGDPSCFLFEMLFRDGRRIHRLLLRVNDSAAEYGVLSVDYADLT
jgi:hypothetical protein